MKKVVLLLSILVFEVSALSAQVTVFAANDTIDYDQSKYTTEVKVSGFNKIVGAQFTMVWDSTILQFNSISDFGFDLSSDDHFGKEQASGGIMRFAWFDNSLQGVSLSDSSTLFSVSFDVINKRPGAYTEIAFVDTPAVREISDTSYSAIASKFVNGSLTLDATGTVSALRNNPEFLRFVSASPNPVKQDPLRIEFFIKRTDTLTFRIVSMDGRVLQSFDESFQAGNHSKTFDRNTFPASGTYFIQLIGSKFQAVQKVMAIK